MIYNGTIHANARHLVKGINKELKKWKRTPLPISLQGDLKKGAISFISTDKQHGHQQVGKFEQCIVEIIRSQLGRQVNDWTRMSDGCGAQFKSRICVADLMKACKTYDLKQPAFHYFASHEGKNTSDTIGSIVKSLLQQGMFKNNEIEIRSADSVIEIFGHK